jgi:hypothetical protein
VEIAVWVDIATELEVAICLTEAFALIDSELTVVGC